MFALRLDFFLCAAHASAKSTARTTVSSIKAEKNAWPFHKEGVSLRIPTADTWLWCHGTGRPLLAVHLKEGMKECRIVRRLSVKSLSACIIIILIVTCHRYAILTPQSYIVDNSHQYCIWSSMLRTVKPAHPIRSIVIFLSETVEHDLLLACLYVDVKTDEAKDLLPV